MQLDHVLQNVTSWISLAGVLAGVVGADHLVGEVPWVVAVVPAALAVAHGHNLEQLSFEIWSIESLAVGVIFGPSQWYWKELATF